MRGECRWQGHSDATIAPEAPIQGHDPEQETKVNRKKMAVVGTVYTIDPFVRTPEEVVVSLFRRPDDRLVVSVRCHNINASGRVCLTTKTSRRCRPWRTLPGWRRKWEDAPED